MSLNKFSDLLSWKVSAKFALAFVFSTLLSACGAGGGGEDTLVNGTNLDSQTSTEEEQDQDQVVVAPVQISTQPQSLTVDAGANAIFSISASGGGTLSFQWRKDEQNISGATGNTLVVNNVTDADEALYDVIVSNSAGSQYSLSALLTVNPEVIVLPPVEPVAIVSQPQALTVVENTSASFSVQATGDGVISYQWLKDGQAINGASASTYSISSVSDADAAAYSVRVTNPQGSVLSNAVALTVTALPEPVVIVTQPQALTVSENASASFSVQATGSGEIGYQWLKDGEIIDGAIGASFNIDSVASSDVASYSVIVTNSEGPVVSESASLSLSVVEVVTSIELTWDIPQEREDGSDLPLGEINGYVIVYGTDQNNLTSQLVIEGASVTSTILEDLNTGTYYFSIATVDSDGVQGAYSGVINQSI